MTRIEVNIQTGETKEVVLTPAEVTAAEARTAEEAAKPAPPSYGQQLVAQIMADPTALDTLRAALGK